MREPLGTNDLKEGAAGAVGEKTPRKSRATGRNVILITDIASTALGKLEMAERV
jgi:hypothetical protein